MGLEKIGTKFITAWVKSCEKSLVAMKPVKVNTAGLKLAPKLKGDVVEISQQTNCLIKNPKEYDDIVQNMVMQRKNMINTVHENTPIEETLQNFKDNYITANREIRNKIMSELGNEDAIYSANFLRTSTSKLDNLIIQGYLPKDTILYRGATPYDFGLSDISSQEFIKKFYKKGRLFKIPIYPETSLDMKIGESFANGNIMFKINTPKGTPGIYMEKLGLSKIGNYGNEEEVLIARNLTYKFKSHTQKEGYDLIELDIVHNKPFWKKIHEFWNEIN